MINLTRFFTVTSTALAFTLFGCDKSSHTHATSSEETHAGHDHADNDDHDHDDDDHDDHDHDDHDGHDDDDHDDHDHGESALDFGAFEIGGSKLSMSVSGSVTPNNELHVDVNHIRGPMPETIRLWVGIETGVGSLKSKADREDNHWHGHVECPNSIDTDTKLWIETESSDGTRTSMSFPLS